MIQSFSRHFDIILRLDSHLDNSDLLFYLLYSELSCLIILFLYFHISLQFPQKNKKQDTYVLVNDCDFSFPPGPTSRGSTNTHITHALVHTLLYNVYCIYIHTIRKIYQNNSNRIKRTQSYKVVYSVLKLLRFYQSFNVLFISCQCKQTENSMRSIRLTQHIISRIYRCT